MSSSTASSGPWREELSGELEQGRRLHEISVGDGLSQRSERPCPDHEAAHPLGAGHPARRSSEYPAGADPRGRPPRGPRWPRVLNRPVRLDDKVLDTLARYVDLAPLHNAPSLAVIRAARTLLPDVPHVAVFDTGFHHDLPQGARTYAPTGRPVRSGGPAALRLPRDLLRVPRRRVDGAADRAGAAHNPMPPGRRRERDGCARRPLARHQHGLHAVGGARDGDAGRRF